MENLGCNSLASSSRQTLCLATGCWASEGSTSNTLQLLKLHACSSSTSSPCKYALLSHASSWRLAVVRCAAHGGLAVPRHERILRHERGGPSQLSTGGEVLVQVTCMQGHASKDPLLHALHTHAGMHAAHPPVQHAALGWAGQVLCTTHDGKVGLAHASAMGPSTSDFATALRWTALPSVGQHGRPPSAAAVQAALGKCMRCSPSLLHMPGTCTLRQAVPLSRRRNEPLSKARQQIAVLAHSSGVDREQHQQQQRLVLAVSTSPVGCFQHGAQYQRCRRQRCLLLAINTCVVGQA